MTTGSLNILLIGSGGREHALAWALGRSPSCGRLFTAPGNPGTAAHGENRPDLAVTDHAAVIAFCRERMARFKVPKAVVFGPLPKTSTGKIQKFVLREQARSL